MATIWNWILEASSLALTLAVLGLAIYVAFKLADEIRAIAKVVKQVYSDSAWRQAGIRWRETGKKEIEWERDIEARTPEDVELAKYGAVALALIFGIVILGILLFFGLTVIEGIEVVMHEAPFDMDMGESSYFEE